MPFKDPEKEREYKHQKHLENREENLAKMRAYYAANKETMNKQSREWYEKNKARISEENKLHRKERTAKARAWRLANPEKMREIKRAWRLKNLEKVRAQAKASRERNKAACAARLLKWQRANPDKCSVYRKRHYAKNPEAAFNDTYRRRKLIVGKLTRGLSRRLFSSQNGLCAICNLPMEEGKYHRDHIIPVSRGGLHVDSNIQLTHPKCNLSKGAKAPTKKPSPHEA